VGGLCADRAKPFNKAELDEIFRPSTDNYDDGALPMPAWW
jgi:hypothetical protein